MESDSIFFKLLFESHILRIENIQIRPTFREKLIEQLKGTFGEYYDYHYRDIATHEVDDLNMEDPYSFSHRTWELEYQRKQELQKKHPVQSRQKSHNTEL